MGWPKTGGNVSDTRYRQHSRLCFRRTVSRARDLLARNRCAATWPIDREETVMTWGIPTHLFLQIHVALSLIGIVAGLIVLYGLLAGRALGGWTALFLATTILTSVTGFPLPPFGLDPPRMVGILSLILLAVAVAAYYVFHLDGAWRWVYVVTAMVALYLNCFVAVIQSFSKISIPACAGADAIGTAVPHCANRRACLVCSPGLPLGTQISSANRVTTGRLRNNASLRAGAPARPGPIWPSRPLPHKSPAGSRAAGCRDRALAVPRRRAG